MNASEVAARTSRRHLRTVEGSSFVEAFVIIAIVTILIVRLYLRLTGYPQVGNGTLHIAHMLWGGLLMIGAVVCLVGFIDIGAKSVATVMAGVGFGLFMDEVGKFVTADNDYFFRPAVAIMYVTFLLIVLSGRWLRDRRPLTSAESLANVGVIAVEGVTRGITTDRRDLGLELIDHAEEGGEDLAVVRSYRDMLARAKTSPGRVRILNLKLAHFVPAFLRRPVWVRVAAWLLVLNAMFGVFGVMGYLNSLFDVDVDVGGVGFTIVDVSALVVSIVVFVLAAPEALLGTAKRSTTPWRLRMLRYSALVTVLLLQVFSLAVEEFAGLVNVSIGLLALAVVSRRLREIEHPH